MAQKGTRGGKGRRLDTTATADDRLRRHLRALGLESAAAYRAWCRRHGFRDSLQKSWQEWREERVAAEKGAAALATAAEAQSHLQALGLKDVSEYQEWCRRHGFGDALRKSRQQRQQELRVFERERGQTALAGARRQTRRPLETIEAIFRGEIAREELKTPYLARIHDLFTSESSPAVRETLRRLLRHVERHAGMLSVDPVIAAFGSQPGNTYLDALHALARHEEGWLRSLEEWRPDSRSRRRQFGGLVRHLLARYFVPEFMDAAWFRGDSLEARRQQAWFRHIGLGQNIRTAELPLSLTKKMAHHFLAAPDDYTIEAALRWGQIVGMGGDEPLVRAVVATRLGEQFEHEEFWATVLQWFVNHPMLDPACIGPIVDYIHNQKFVPRERLADDGPVHPMGPAEPGFQMKGRSAAALLERVEAWHARLAREARRPSHRWEPSGIGEYQFVQEERQSGNVICWTIRELLSSQELREEGKALNHCVASYAHSCVQGRVSIWSMRMEDTQQPVPRRIMTIEVKGRTICQARGRANLYPGSTRGGTRLRGANGILHQWAAAEGLRVARHL